MDAAFAKLAPLFEKLQPLLEEVVPVCPCLETPEMKARRERRAMLCAGEKFSRKKQTFGINFGGTEDVSLALSGDGRSLGWFVTPAGKGTNSGALEMSDVASVGAKSPCSLTVMSTKGDLLLELEAEGEAMRDAWVTALNEAVPRRAPGELARGQPSTVAGRAAKQAYFVQKGVELASKRKDADTKKQKYLAGAGGLKFTALAMANRSGDD